MSCGCLVFSLKSLKFYFCTRINLRSRESSLKKFSIVQIRRGQEEFVDTRLFDWIREFSFILCLLSV